MSLSIHGLFTIAITGLMFFAAGSSSATHIHPEVIIDGDGTGEFTTAVPVDDRHSTVQDIPDETVRRQGTLGELRHGLARAVARTGGHPRVESPENDSSQEAVTKQTKEEVPEKTNDKRRLVPPRFAEGLIIGRAQYTHVDDQKKRRLTLDTYRPKNIAPNTKLPILVIYFGGGWINGRPGHMTPLAQAIAQRGYVTVVPNYRLSREAPFPAAIHDCKAAIRWARSHAKSLKGDPDKIAVTGGSAGGHLAGLVAATNGLQEFEGHESNVSSEVQALIVMCGSMDLLSESTQKNIKLSEERGQVHPIIQFLGGPPSKRRQAYIKASPNTHLSKSMPPSLFIDGELDNPRIRYTETWKKMDDLGISHEFVLMEDGPHPFWNYEQWFDATIKAFDTFLTKQFKNDIN
ncbi:MAG: alpha/beta hydrolase [Planctomycetota bacterium]|nr:alpha/beta hydrolase [Planctomycetota bacterium]